MNRINRLKRRIDYFQRQNRPLAFSYAVIKKYGEDETGNLAALLTYYSFLALFPLLLVMVTLTNAILGSYSHLQQSILKSVTNYFPLLGNQLATHVHGLRANGLALIVGLLFTIYGARGVANAFRHGVQRIWHIPKKEQEGFPQSLYKSLKLIIIGGLGFVLAAISAGLASAAGHSALFRCLSIAVNIVILFWLFTFLIKTSLPKRVTVKEIQIGAGVATLGLVILQLLGNYILARELKNLDVLYSYFALALGLLFWIYLQAQVIFYAVQISVVSSRKLWPRSLDDRLPTQADEQLNRNAS
jgi:membrane protein